ncbi:MAG: molecular chaperone [Planctomycetota bacterium]
MGGSLQESLALNPAPFVLASLLMSYPTDELPGNIKVLLEDRGVSLPEELRTLITSSTDPGTIQDLQSEYIGIFDNGRDSNPICETEYDRRRPMAKGTLLSDIAGFYHAFGFTLDESGPREMLDHAGIELEFYALLIMKQIHLTETGDVDGAAIVEDGKRKFLEAHLGRFIVSIARRPGVQSSAFYGPVASWCAKLIENECRQTAVSPVTADWIDGDESADQGDIKCCL